MNAPESTPTTPSAYAMLEAMCGWELKAGSHEFPGPSGGTCINEASLVAWGFAYRQIKSVDEMPDCFSRPISRLALTLNDRMRDDERHVLMPFVWRLGGTADTPKIENKRVEILLISMTNQLLATILDKYEFEKEAALCRAASTMAACRTSARTVMDKLKNTHAIALDLLDHTLALALDHTLAIALDFLDHTLAIALDHTLALELDHTLALELDRKLFCQWGVAALEAMLAIGNRAPEADLAEVQMRVETALAAARERAVA